jgi:cytoskeleton protein RodZ
LGATTPIGEQLRNARRARGIDLEQVEEKTKIRARFLRAMEDEDWEILPGAAFARSFLHTYAQYLGLDAEELVDEYRRRESQEPPPEPVPQISSPGRRRPRRRERAPGARRPAWAVLVAIGLAAILGALLVVGLVGDTGDERNEPGRAAGSAKPKDSKPQEKPASPPSRATVRLTTTATVWVCLVDGSGNALIEGVTLPAGEKQGPFRAGALALSAGNGGVEIEANGEPVPVPDAAEPFGVRVTPEGTEELAPPDRPTCT